MEREKTYSASEVSCDWGGMTITGYATGEAIKGEPNADKFTQKIGIKGEVVISENLDKSGTVTLKLFSTSASLAQMRKDSQDGARKQFTVRNKAADGGLVLSRPNCTIKRVPGFSFGEEVSEVEVQINIPRFEYQ